MRMIEVPTDFYYKNCMYCGRPMIVRVGRTGVSHMAGLDVACIECIPKKHMTEPIKSLIEANKKPNLNITNKQMRA